MVMVHESVDDLRFSLRWIYAGGALALLWGSIQALNIASPSPSLFAFLERAADVYLDPTSTPGSHRRSDLRAALVCRADYFAVAALVPGGCLEWLHRFPPPLALADGRMAAGRLVGHLIALYILARRPDEPGRSGFHQFLVVSPAPAARQGYGSVRMATRRRWLSRA